MADDAALVRETLSGNTEAYDTLMRRHFGLVYVIGLARLGDADQAEDLAQEVFLRAYLHLKRLDPPAKYPAWVSRIARNLAIDWLRRGQRASRLLTMVPLEKHAQTLPDPKAKGASDIMANAEESAALKRAIRTLKPEQREMLLLQYVEGMGQREIADHLGVHQTTVSRVLKKALEAMRGQLEPILREAASGMKPPTHAVTKASVFIAAAAAMSTTAKASLASSATVPAFSLGASASLPSLFTGGANAMATGKGIIMGVVAAAAIGGGGLYLAQGNTESGPEVPSKEGIYAVGSQGEMIELAQFTFEEMEALEEQFQANPDMAAVYAQVQAPTIPRDSHLIVNRPGTHWVEHSADTGVTRRGYDLDQIVFETRRTPSLGEVWTERSDMPGIWDVTFSEEVVGDMLGIFWESQDREERVAWLARFGDASAYLSASPDDIRLRLDFTPGTTWSTRSRSTRDLIFETVVLEPDDQGNTRLESTILRSSQDGVAEEVPTDENLLVLDENLIFVDASSGPIYTDRALQLALLPGGFPEGAVEVGDTWTRDDVHLWGDALRQDSVSRLENVEMVNAEQLAVIHTRMEGEIELTGGDISRSEVDIEHRLWVERGRLEQTTVKWVILRNGQVDSETDWLITFEYPNAPRSVNFIPEQGTPVRLRQIPTPPGESPIGVDRLEIRDLEDLMRLAPTSVPREAGLRFRVRHLPNDPVFTWASAQSFDLQTGDPRELQAEIFLPEYEANDWEVIINEEPTGDLLLMVILGEAWVARIGPQVDPVAATRQCQENLMKIDGATQQWALENRQPMDATVAMDRLIGPQNYIRNTPVCPMGGTYGSSAGPNVFRVYENPTCSFGGEHNIDF